MQTQTRSLIWSAVLVGCLLAVSGTAAKGQTSINVYSLDHYYYIDGNFYPYTATGIQNALNDASTNGGGTVVLPPTGSLSNGVIAMGNSNVTVPSNVCLVGAGPGQQTHLKWTSTPSTSAIYLAAGTTHACVKDLSIEFSSAASNAAGIEIVGNGAQATQFNTFRDIYIIFDSLSAGSVGVYGAGSTSNIAVSLNTFDNIVVEQADEMVQCDYCEGNFWTNVQGINLGITNSQVLFYEPNAGDEFLDVRIESGSSNPSGLTCYSTGGKFIIARITCDAANTTNALNDSGANNIFQLSLVGSKVSVGTIAPTSLATVTSESTGSTYLQSPRIDQSVARAFAGACSMPSSTSCTITITASYTNPICVATVQGTSAIAGSCSVSGTTVTVHAAATNSFTWAAFVFGNPH